MAAIDRTDVDVSSSQTLINKTISGSSNTITLPLSSTTGTLPVGNGGTGATTLTGLVKGTGTTAMVAATAGTDYIAPDANTNITANGYYATRTSTATAAGTTTLTITSSQVQVFTGSTTQIVKLPTTGVIAGQSYTIINNSTGTVSIQSSSGAGLPMGLGASTSATYTALKDTPTASADWSASGITSYMGATINSTAVRDDYANLTATGFVGRLTSTATSGGTTALVNNSFENQLFTGTTTHTCTLPTTGVPAGRNFTIVNNSTGSVTVNASGGGTVATLTASTAGTFLALQATPTTAAHWFKVA